MVQVIQLTEDQRDKHFDPELVDVFLANQQHFNAIRMANED